MSVHDEIICDLMQLKRQLDVETSRKIRIELYESIIVRMQHLSGEIHECSDYLDKLKLVLEELKTAEGRPSRSDIRLLKEIRKQLTTHLKGHHNLIPRGQYLARFTIIGVIIGLIVGYFTLEYTMMGAFFGAIIGIAIGSRLDLDARKKGIQI